MIHWSREPVHLICTSDVTSSYCAPWVSARLWQLNPLPFRPLPSTPVLYCTSSAAQTSFCCQCTFFREETQNHDRPFLKAWRRRRLNSRNSSTAKGQRPCWKGLLLFPFCSIPELQIIEFKILRLTIEIRKRLKWWWSLWTQRGMMPLCSLVLHIKTLLLSTCSVFGMTFSRFEESFSSAYSDYQTNVKIVVLFACWHGGIWQNLFSLWISAVIDLSLVYQEGSKSYTMCCGWKNTISKKRKKARLPLVKPVHQQLLNYTSN